jgi:hypothetical protein
MRRLGNMVKVFFHASKNNLFGNPITWERREPIPPEAFC